MLRVGIWLMNDYLDDECKCGFSATERRYKSDFECGFGGCRGYVNSDHVYMGTQKLMGYGYPK